MGRPRHPEPLTPSEQRVFEAIRGGRTNAEIATSLGISQNTVRYHVKNIRSKLAADESAILSERELERRGWRRAMLALKVSFGVASGMAVLVVALAIVTSLGGNGGELDEFAMVIVEALPGEQSQLVKIDGNGDRNVMVGPLPGSIAHLGPSPDHEQLAFVLIPPPDADACARLRGCPLAMPIGTLMVANVDAGTIEMRAEHVSDTGAAGLRWTADGQVIAEDFTGDSVFHAGAARIEPYPAGCDHRSFAVSGDWVSCSSFEGGNATHSVVRIARLPGDLADRGAHWQINVPGGGTFAQSFSPDGRRVAWTSTNFGIYEVWTADLPTGEPGMSSASHARLVRDGSDPVWSPDSRYIAFSARESSTEDAVANIFVFDTVTGEISHPAPSKTAGQLFPRWSPDGRRLGFVSYTGEPTLMEVNRDGSGLRRVADGAWYFAWVAD